MIRVVKLQNRYIEEWDGLLYPNYSTFLVSLEGTSNILPFLRGEFAWILQFCMDIKVNSWRTQIIPRTFHGVLKTFLGYVLEALFPLSYISEEELKNREVARYSHHDILIEWSPIDYYKIIN